MSHLLHALGARDAGASRSSVIAGSAPLVAVAIALVPLGEPLVVGLALGPRPS